ncbi:MAG: MFS transporter [Alphaproteobacteria bacterium]|nr:MFS transporter [Alphaproteobacteria bacterium]MBP9776955.1 MFS transporter [Alphaproteobacteria bacterium]
MKKNYKAIIAAMIGNALEYYDVMLYGFFATMLAPLFFPTDNEAISIISSLGTFAAGFLMRPLGGIVFGHLGDKFGRRQALVFAIFLVTIPTLIIGLLPTYADIGIAASIILVICRLLQGLCVGGEYSGASIFVIEYSKRGKEAFAGSILCAAGFFGGVLGTFFGFLCTNPFMPSWGWRIPFLIGALIGLIGYYLRTQVSESPDFVRHKKEKIAKVPLLVVFERRLINLCCTIGIGATSLIPFYLASVYMGYMLSSQLQIPTFQIMLINVVLNIFLIFLLPTMGILADKIGKEKLMIFSSVLSIIVAYPLFSLLENNLSLTNILIVQAILGIITAGFGAPSMALLSSFFPTHERYSGIGFGYALGGALLGGTTPLILASLSNWLGSPLVPAYYLMFSGALGVICVVNGRKVDSKTSPVFSPQKKSFSPILTSAEIKL